MYGTHTPTFCFRKYNLAVYVERTAVLNSARMLGNQSDSRYGVIAYLSYYWELLVIAMVLEDVRASTAKDQVSG